MHNNIDQLFNALWQDYLTLAPSAEKIHRLLSQGEEIINDHVAFRTFNLDKINLSVLAAHLEQVGYVAVGDYEFTDKKLKAKHFEHPDSSQPKIFISELCVELCSEKLQSIVKGLVEPIPLDVTTADNFLYSGRHWNVDIESYNTLLAESEYAAWVAAFGFHANHFTVSINHLKGFNDIYAVNESLKAAGFILNSVGGEVKGSAEVMLQQSSTMADKVAVDFNGITKIIPSCFYEFALRYPKADGKLYSGFVVASADKIFASTDAVK